MYAPPPPGAPNPLMSLRPMGIGDMLDETLRLYRHNFTLFVGTCAVIEVPLQAIIFLLTVGILGAVQPLNTLGGTSGRLTPAQQAELTHDLLVFGGFTLAVVAVALVAFAAESAALAVIISNRYLERPATVGMAYRAALDRLGPLLLALLWAFIRLIPFMILSVVLVGIPFLILFFVAWSLIPQAIMLEGADGLAASGRSRLLMRDYWWRSFGLLVVTAVFLTIIAQIPTAIVDNATSSATGAFEARGLVDLVIGLVVGILIRPVQTAATTLLFYDLKIRKEGFALDAQV